MQYPNVYMRHGRAFPLVAPPLTVLTARHIGAIKSDTGRDYIIVLSYIILYVLEFVGASLQCSRKAAPIPSPILQSGDARSRHVAL